MITRRRFNQGLVAVALAGLSRHLLAADHATSQLINTSKGYGPLISDPEGVIDLPKGFSYKVISKLGDMMADGLPVPDAADGMGCFDLGNGRVALVRNHELSPKKELAPKLQGTGIDQKRVYDHETTENWFFPGGTSNIVYNLNTGKVEHQFMSLLGTVRNCSGGITPWGSWLTCEESVLVATERNTKAHGYVFEVPADAKSLVDAKPIIAMGRFNHEAACIDPNTGIVYLTEDRSDSLFYRFIPNNKRDLHAGGRLQALVVEKQPKFDSRNWEKHSMSLNQPLEVSWVDLDNPESPKDDLRMRGLAKGAALFARGEGIHWADKELYFVCTSGGAKKLGQVMRYQPSKFEGSDKEKSQPGILSLFVESPNEATFNFGDNIVVAPNGHLVVCEDQYSDEVNNKLKGITLDGKVYDFAKVRWQTEPAGACFSADGKTMFVNLYSPTATLAITGPWDSFKA